MGAAAAGSLSRLLYRTFRFRTILFSADELIEILFFSACARPLRRAILALFLIFSMEVHLAETQSQTAGRHPAGEYPGISDCNPLTYLKGSLRAYKFRGHNYSNSQHYIYSRISRLQRRQRWTIWQYYTLGKLTHYLADAFTYPHNENYPDSMLCHHQYETDLRAYLEEYLATRALRREKFRQDVADALQELHRQYMAGVADMRKDVQFILKATSLLMAGCLPASAAAAV